MTPAARVQAAIEVLDQILEGAPAEKALTGWARRSRFAGSKDRAAVRDHVFDGLRRRDSAAHLGGSLTGRGIMLGGLRLDGVAPETLFTGEGHAPEVLSDSEKTVPTSDAPRDMPDWLVAPLRESLGAEFDATVEQLRSRAPVILRVNLRKCAVGDAQVRLSDDGIETKPMALVETALQVTSGARKIKQSSAFRDGLVELQDASSQAMVSELPLFKGMKVLDYCAGGGGKSLAMAGREQARFYAHDAAPKRMTDLPERAKRAGVKISQIADPAGQAPYDLVLCDVPCSGSGTWRRTPDAKWRFSESDLAAIVKVQAQIIRDASALVAPGGALGYATCSLLRDENAWQIEHFLDSHNADWTLEWQRQYHLKDGGDGFFGAVLRQI